MTALAHLEGFAVRPPPPMREMPEIANHTELVWWFFFSFVYMLG